MTLPATAAEVLSDHVLFEIESVDRMYLNLYQPRLQHGAGIAAFFVGHRFTSDIRHFIEARGLDLVRFAGGQRKDDVTQEYLRAAEADGRGPGARAGPVRRGRAGEAAGVPDPEAHEPGHRRDLPVANALDRHPHRPGLPAGFTNRDLRNCLALLRGLTPEDMTSGQITYDLRRLRIHGLIRRVPGSFRYQVTGTGLRQARFLTRLCGAW